MACTFCRSRRRSLPPSRSSWWVPTAVLFSVSAAAALAFQAFPSSQHQSARTLAASRLCRGKAYGAGGSWSSATSVEERPPGPGSQRRYRSDPAATTTALASMAPGTGVLAQEEDDRTRCACARSLLQRRHEVSNWQPALGSFSRVSEIWNNLLGVVFPAVGVHERVMSKKKKTPRDAYHNRGRELKRHYPQSPKMVESRPS